MITVVIMPKHLKGHHKHHEPQMNSLVNRVRSINHRMVDWIAPTHLAQLVGGRQG